MPTTDKAVPEPLIAACHSPSTNAATPKSVNRPRPSRVMADALRKLPQQPLPSAAAIEGLLDGLTTIHQRVTLLFEGASDLRERAVQHGG